MSKELVISATSHERRVAIVEEGQLVEIYIEREKEFALVGSIYKGKVTRVLPGMQSAFVDIGLDGDAFLYVSDVFENLEDYDHGHAHTEPAVAAAPLPGESLSAAHEESQVVETHSVDLHDSGHITEGHQPGMLHDAGHDEHQQPPILRSEPQTPEHELSELDERQPESNASAPQNFAPRYNPTQNYPRAGGDRGRQNFGRGNDRGQNAGDRGNGRCADAEFAGDCKWRAYQRRAARASATARGWNSGSGRLLIGIFRDQSPRASIASMSASDRPKWWPISCTSTWVTMAPSVSSCAAQ